MNGHFLFLPYLFMSLYISEFIQSGSRSIPIMFIRLNPGLNRKVSEHEFDKIT